MGRLGDMEIFVVIAELGSITGAAERLGLAKSAVSRRLAGLETRLGAQLIHRTTRRLRLTEEGEIFYRDCQRILADIREAEQSVCREHLSLEGRLRLAVPLSFGVAQLGPVLTAFMADHPKVRFDIHFSDRHVDLLEEEFDLAIRIGTMKSTSHMARLIRPIRHHVCASPAYWKSKGKPETPAALAGFDYLKYAPHPDRLSWRSTTAEGAEQTVVLRPKHHCNNGDFLLHAALLGQGFVLLPDFLVSEPLGDGRLETALAGYSWTEMKLVLLYPKTRHLSSRVRAFMDFLVDHFGKEAVGTGFL